MKNINDINYSEFVGLINERNRPSGGIKTVQEVIVNARLDGRSKILEIGSNTGFTSVNLSLLTGAEVVGIDVNEESVEKAKKYASCMGADTVSFLQGSALKLPFPDQVFDLVWCSNVTSFIDDKTGAISEYLRVLKPGGLLAVVPIYYRVTPPAQLVEEVSKAIDCKIEVWDKQYWVDLFRRIGDSQDVALEVIYSKDYRYLDQGERIEKYVKTLLENNLDEATKKSPDFEKIVERAKYFYQLFNENNSKYAGYSVILMQKRKMLDEEELYLSEGI